MLASKVIDLAKNTELRQLGVKDNVEAVLGFVNLGMLELYKRFPLKTDEAIVTLRDGKTTYLLDGTDVDVSISSVENFLLVSECYDEQGELVLINDESDPLGIMTPSYNTIEVPNVAEGEKLSLIYRCAPNFATAVTNNLILPPQLLEALLHYIGYRGNATISSDTKAENNAHYIRFEQSCNRVIEQGLILPDDLEALNFELRGFV